MARGKKNEKEITIEERLKQALVPAEEQPYSVPENWCWVTLATVCKNIRAGGDKPKTFSEEKTDKIQIPVVANGTHNEGIIGYTDIASEEGGTVTVAGRGTIGFSLVRNYSYYPVIRLIVIQPYNIVLPTYIKYIFDCFEEKGTGSSIPQLTVPAISTKKIPISPFAEQQRIVDRIESLFAKLDEAKEKAQAVVDGFETRKAAILHKAFTGELTAKWREENNIMLDSWQKSTLESVCSSIFDGDHLPPPKSNEGIPFLVISNVNTGHLSYENTQFVPESYYNSLSETRKPEVGDLLYTLVGSYGIPVVVDDERSFCFQRHMALLKLKEIDTYFMWYLLQSQEMYSKATSIATGTAQLTVPIKGLRKIEFMCPSDNEQKEIVRLLNFIFIKEQRAKETAEAVLDQIEAMKKSILARAFRGELGTNDPAEESAEALLKQISH